MSNGGLCGFKHAIWVLFQIFGLRVTARGRGDTVSRWGISLNGSQTDLYILQGLLYRTLKSHPNWSSF